MCKIDKPTISQSVFLESLQQHVRQLSNEPDFRVENMASRIKNRRRSTEQKSCTDVADSSGV